HGVQRASARRRAIREQGRNIRVFKEGRESRGFSFRHHKRSPKVKILALKHASFGETGRDRKPAEPVDREARFMGHVDMSRLDRAAVAEEHVEESDGTGWRQVS